MSQLLLHQASAMTPLRYCSMDCVDMQSTGTAHLTCTYVPHRCFISHAYNTLPFLNCSCALMVLMFCAYATLHCSQEVLVSASQFPAVSVGASVGISHSSTNLLLLLHAPSCCHKQLQSCGLFQTPQLQQLLTSKLTAHRNSCTGCP